MITPQLQFAKHAAVAIGSIAAATFLRAAIDALLHEPIQYTTFYLAVMVTALYGGLAWGLACTALSAVAASFWLTPLGQPLITETSDLAEMSLFLVTSGFIAWLSDRMRQHKRQAEAASEERQRLLLAEQAARREAERLNHAKDDFLATVSHELRTPLQSILGWSQLLREYEMSAEETDIATASIERSVRVQNQLINDLLDLSRIVMGKLRLEPRPVSLSDVVRSASQTVHPAAEAKNVTVHVESHGEGVVLGDADRLQQIAWNLLSNAIKFTPSGGTVRAAVWQQGERVELVIRDTGEGIDVDFLPKVFERFRQAESGLHPEGLGLGLAIVKELVELHGGTVRVHSAGKGQGAEFRVILPKYSPSVHASSAMTPADGFGVAVDRAKSVVRDSSAALAGKQVLVVDDDAEACQLIKSVLNRYGADVLTAESASRANELLRDHQPDVVTCDLDMPNIDGFEFVRQLRHDHFGQPPMPVIAVTASASEADRLRVLESGFQEHLGKPVEPRQLVAAVAALTLDE